MTVRSIREAILLLLLAAVLGFSYTFLTKKGFFSPPSPASAASPDQLEVIDVAQARALFDDPSVVFVDARHPFEFNEGHIARALNIPLADLEKGLVAPDTALRQRIIVVYCDGAECNSSMQEGVRLAEGGFTRVRVFFGGWSEWTGHGYPTERSVKP